MPNVTATCCKFTDSHGGEDTNCFMQVTASFRERHTFNVAVSELMILSNTLRDGRSLAGSPAHHSALETLCLLLAPMAPHISSQLWEGK